jgi:hypothetical protein
MADGGSISTVQRRLPVVKSPQDIFGLSENMKQCIRQLHLNYTFNYLRAISPVVSQESMPFGNRISVFDQELVSSVLCVLWEVFVTYESRTAKLQERPKEWTVRG